MLNTERPPTRLNTLTVWAVALGCIAATVIGEWLVRRYRNSPSDGSSTVWFVCCSAIPAVGAFILSRRPGHAVGLNMLICGVFASLQVLAGGLGLLTLAQPRPFILLTLSMGALSASLWSGVLTLVLAIALFPTGRFMSPRWRWVGAALLAAPVLIIGTTLAYMYLEQPSIAVLESEQNPMQDKPAYAAALALAGVCASVGFAGALLSLLVRAWRSRGLERQQIKWFALFGSAGIVVFFLPNVLPWAFNIRSAWIQVFIDSAIGELISTAALLGMIAAISIAIVRHKLFDIDVIIRKTLQWTVVTVLLGAVYVLSVLGLQELFKRVTGQTSEVAVALSTLALAAAFMPIRRAAQNLIDKRFYRKRYNAQQVVEAYAESIKDEVDVNVIHQKMLTVLGETLQPKRITLFLVKQPRDR